MKINVLRASKLFAQHRNFAAVLLHAVTVAGCRTSTTSTMSSKYAKLKTLADFGYAFNQEGQLRDVKTGDKFTFVDQDHYESLGEVITDEVYKLLQDRAGLVPHYLDSQKKSFVFVSPGFSEKSSLLCLIHGSGVVRAGQWARKLIINNDLEKGTQIPYIKEAIRLGLGVVVFNTNQNQYLDENGAKKKLDGSASPEQHAVTVWKQLVTTSKAEKIVIVAHSYGGVVTMSLADSEQQDFISRVRGVYFTDSVHYSLSKSPAVNEKLVATTKNYVTSDKPVGELIKSSSGGKDVARLSAGHKVHEWTSWSAQHTIFKEIKSVLDIKEEEGNLPRSEL